MSQTIGLEPLAENDSPRWTIEVSCPEIDIIRNNYKDISEEEFDKTIKSAVKLLAECPNPRSSAGAKRGLAIGKIQSGKTLSFTTLIALAASNGYSKIIVLAGTKTSLFKQTFDRLKKDLLQKKINAFDNPTINQLGVIRNILDLKRCALLVVLKQKDHLKDITELISSPDMPKGPTLIIDDEGDEASLNNYFRKNGESTIYKGIKSLLGALPVHAYIAYTATPQANLLISAIDNLTPKFCQLIEPGTGYCGSSTFFGERQNEFIRVIEDVSEDAPETAPVPESLKNPLALFFWTGTISSVRKEDIGRQSLLSRFKKAYEDLLKTVKDANWDLIEKRLDYELRAHEIHMVNSLQDGIQIAEANFQLENNIIIGGNILGRGVTIKDLTVSYVARRARRITNVDTMAQRARWCGYKSEYLDLCRIYLPQRVIGDFEGILYQEDDLWEALERNHRQRLPIESWPRLLASFTSDLRPTRTSVANFHKFVPEGWTTQSPKPSFKDEQTEHNSKVIQKFLKENNAIEEDIGVIYKFVRNCDTSNVITNLLCKLDLSGTDWNLAYYIEYLNRLVLSRKLQKMDIVLMSGGDEGEAGGWRRRELLDNGRINNIFSAGSPPKRPADRNIHGDKVQLQIHKVICTRNKIESTRTVALALYIPNNQDYNLSYIVREEPL
ncbi:hypothetical protein J4410_07840 [Candidatus Woesearchaeota archaeon]|nr:hypothetical protein [Candidatus Woesearchaeota archaeon]